MDSIINTYDREFVNIDNQLDTIRNSLQDDSPPQDNRPTSPDPQLLELINTAVTRNSSTWQAKLTTASKEWTTQFQSIKNTVETMQTAITTKDQNIEKAHNDLTQARNTIQHLS